MPTPNLPPPGSDLAALAIFSSREDVEVLSATVAAALRAAPGAVGVVDVLINGNLELATRLAERLPSFTLPAAPCRLRVWQFMLGDKSHTWNEYVAGIAPRDRHCFFVDGYAAVSHDALRHMKIALDDDWEALAATGVPTVGLSASGAAREMRNHGGIHGNLYALSARAMAQRRQLGFRLPLGLYRTDPTLGAALSFGFDLSPREWQPLRRIRVCDQAHWRMRSLRWWHPEDLRSHWRRYRRQAQGDLENAAVRHFFYVRKVEFGALPRTAADLVRAWATEAPAEFEAILQSRRFAREAFDRMTTPRDWSAASVPPRLLAEVVAPGTPSLDTSIGST